MVSKCADRPSRPTPCTFCSYSSDNRPEDSSLALVRAPESRRREAPTDKDSGGDPAPAMGRMGAAQEDVIRNIRHVTKQVHYTLEHCIPFQGLCIKEEVCQCNSGKSCLKAMLEAGCTRKGYASDPYKCYSFTSLCMPATIHEPEIAAK